MKIHTKTVWDMETLAIVEDIFHEIPDDSPVALCDRSAQAAANTAAGTAGNTAAGLNASAGAIGGTLNPFLTNETLHPQGYSQQDLTSQLAASEAGAGGAAGGLTGEAQLQAARTRNSSGFTGALDEASRQREKAAASTSEGIAANDADVKLKQQQEGAQGLQGLYGTDQDAALKSMGIQTGDINAGVEAGKSGWLQNATGVISALNGAGTGAAITKYCWIAAEIFGGWYDPRTVRVRGWLWFEFSRTWYGSALVALYRRFGERVAKQIRRDPLLRVLFTPIFNLALRKAQKWSQRACF